MQREMNNMLALYNFRMVMHVDPEYYFLVPNDSLYTALQENNFLF